jgi:hypothetical protein
MEIVVAVASILLIINILQSYSLTIYILAIIWMLPPLILAFILRKRIGSLVSITRDPFKMQPLVILDICLVFPLLCIFGWISIMILIQLYNRKKEEERKNAPWWRLKEYGGKF